MSLILFYDTETQGLPLFDQPSEDVRQPHIVSIAASLIDSDTRREVSSLDAIVKPEGWIIPDDVIAIHGITNERASAEGIGERDVLNAYLQMHDQCTFRVGHNETFDARMIRIALKRFGYSDEFADAFKAAPCRCTMWDSLKPCKLPGRGRGQFKKPKLSEAYQHFFGKPMENAHSARGDVDACIAVFWAIQDATGAELKAFERTQGGSLEVGA